MPPMTPASNRQPYRKLVGKYELRYEIVSDEIIVLRLWHTREQP